MALFNQPIHQTSDSSSINQQIDSETNESIGFYNTLIQTEYAYRKDQGKLLSEIGPLLGSYNRAKAVHEKRREAELESEFYEGDKKLDTSNVSNLEDVQAALNTETKSAGAKELLNGGDPILGGELLNSNRGEKNKTKLLMGLSQDVPGILSYVGANLKFTRADGTTYTRDGASTYQEYIQAERTIRSLIIQQAMDGGTNLYQRRKYLHEALKTEEAIWRKKFLEGQRSAVSSMHDMTLTSELKGDIISLGAEGFINHINGNVSFYSGGLDAGTPGAKQFSREKSFDKVAAMVKDGTLSIPEAMKFYNELKGHQIMGADGGRHTLGNYWKKDIDKLGAAIISKQIDEHNNKTNQLTVEKSQWAFKTRDEFLEVINNGGTITEDMLSEKLEEYKKAFPGEKELPSLIGEWYTKQDEDDDAIVERLEDRWRKQEIITTDDLKGITDTNILATWLPRVKQSSISGLSQSQISIRDSRLKTEVDEYTKETENLGKTPRHNANIEGSTAYFNQQYAKYMKADPSNPEGAFSQAWQDTKSAIYNGSFNSYNNVDLDHDSARNTKRALKAISLDSNAINTTVLPGTKDALKEMAKVIETGKGDIPAIYRLIAKRTGASPYAIGATQVALAQNAEGGSGIKADQPKVDQDVDEQLSFDERLLLLKNGSDGRTNRVLQNAETLNWYLDNIKDDTAVANGGYDYILSPTGGDAHLEKPLTEHTVGEVLELLRTGHQSPGIYTFTPTQLVQALNVSNISADDKFDENTQNLLALNQSRWRIQTQGNKQGFYNDWRELSTLSVEALDKQEQIAENIPSVWNQRQNLLEALIN